MQRARMAGPGALAAEDVLRFLRDPRAHGAQPGALSWVETHMSWVFFTATEALKLKKPVRNAFLDHSTLAGRERDARAELLLNARLAPAVYLGLSAVRRTPEGLRLLPEESPAAAGPVVEWLVRMRRLPEQARLDRRIACRDLDAWDIAPLGERLAGFYLQAPRVRLEPRAWVAHYHREHRANRRLLLDPRWASDEAAEALDRFEAALREQQEAIASRARGGHVREGHGDLRPDHVFLLDPPVVIDCIEFDRRLLRTDPYEEVGGLGLDCSIAGAPWVAPQLHRRLAAALGGEPLPALLRVYIASRALLRARLALGHLADPAVSDAPWWRALAERYVLRVLGLWPGQGPHGWP
ncbi:hypothetical protein ACPOLB_00720 [Rubrivivax sp. RP6-9]|uniref:hypothetical protein n=1 Tax=Rubrivivax sp. RP6-9 TaxID=3415750 RepID=UPI003CC5B904